MQRAKQLTVCLPNEPGALAKMCRALADAEVNIRAISVVDTTEAGLVRFVPDNAKTAVKTLAATGVPVIQTNVRLIELPNKIGALATMAERLSRRKVNINFLYGSTGATRGKAIIVMEAKATA